MAIRSLTGQSKTVKQKAHYVFKPETLKYPADCLNERGLWEKRGNCLLKALNRWLNADHGSRPPSDWRGKLITLWAYALALKGEYDHIRKCKSNSISFSGQNRTVLHLR